MIGKSKKPIKIVADNSIMIGIISLFWLLFRSGTKPSRVVYPCQRAAAATSYTFLLYPFAAFLANLSGAIAPRVVSAVGNSSRRNHIVLTLLLSVSLLFSGLTIYSNFILNPMGALDERIMLTQRLTSVSVVHAENDHLEESLVAAINQIGGIEDLVPEGSKVLIKPNIVRIQAPPDTIDPRLVEALINIVKRRSPSVIWVADGSGEGDTIENFRSLGYSPVAEEAGVELVDLNHGELLQVSLPGGGTVFDSFMLNRVLLEADVFISVACMKTHSQAVVTLAMKNLIGLPAGSVYGTPKAVLHDRAEEKGDDYMAGVITDLCTARKINLAIIDGRVGMEGQGPHDGEPVDLGLLIVGKDPVATDSVASVIMGFDPEKVPTLKLGDEKGLGTNDLHTIEVKGEKLEELYHPFVCADGHDSFLMSARSETLLYQWRNLLIYPAAASWASTVFLGFLFRRSNGNPENRSGKSYVHKPQRIARTSQTYEPSSLVKTSIRQLEDNAESDIRTFRSHVREVRQISAKLGELTRMLESSEVSENTYGIVMDELGTQLSFSVEEILRLREKLELIRAEAKLEWAKEKANLDESEAPEDLERTERDAFLSQRLYSSLHRCEEVISTIDSALSILPVDEETSIIERYLSLLKTRSSPGVSSAQIEKAKEVCQQRLGLISGKWATTRRGSVERIVNLELEASQMKDEIEEIEVRHAVGELDQRSYEYKVSGLKSSQDKVEREISEIRRHIGSMDTKIFRCEELLRENDAEGGI